MHQLKLVLLRRASTNGLNLRFPISTDFKDMNSEGRLGNMGAIRIDRHTCHLKLQSRLGAMRQLEYRLGLIRSRKGYPMLPGS